MCTYFLPRDPVAQQDADLIFVPYSYIIDPAVRAQALGSVDWRNAVIIFDEAHNLEDVRGAGADELLAWLHAPTLRAPTLRTPTPPPGVL